MLTYAAPMIAFGCAITDSRSTRVSPSPGIKRAAEQDSEILPFGSAGLGDASIFRNYNLLLEEASKLDDLEALVLVHQDAEIVDDAFCEKVRRGLSDPDVGILGCAGAIGVRNIAWWDGSVTFASFAHRYEEYGGGEILGATFNLEDAPPGARTGEVDVIDGFMMGLPPWFIENIRFDESLGQFHGYDFDVCQQVRAAGKKVMTEHIRVIHHHSLELIGDVDGWIAAHMRVAEKWDGKLSPVGRPSQATGRSARAGRRPAATPRSCRRTPPSSPATRRSATWRRQLHAIERSASWRLTKPLRWLKAPVRGADEPPSKATRPAAPAVPSALIARSRRAAAGAPRARTRACPPAAAARATPSAPNAREARIRLTASSSRLGRFEALVDLLLAGVPLHQLHDPGLLDPFQNGLRSQGSTISATSSDHGASSGQSSPQPKKIGITARRRPSCSAMKSSIAVITPFRGPPSSERGPLEWKPPLRGRRGSRERA